MPSQRPLARSGSRYAAVVAGLSLLVLCAGLLGCGEPQAAAPAATAAADPDPASPPVATAMPLEIRDPRISLQPGMGAVYLTVVAGGGDRLLSVETPAAAAAETHETLTDEAGVVRMVAHPEGFEVPANGTLELAPGGKHIMLIEPQIAAGAGTVPLTLHFAEAGAIPVEAVVTAGTEVPSGHDAHDAHAGHAMHDAHASHEPHSDEQGAHEGHGGEQAMDHAQHGN